MKSLFSLVAAARRQTSLVLTQEFSSDRFASELSVRDGNDRNAQLLGSVEGDAAETWPCSPVIQQVHQQASDDGEFLAGVGMAGKSVWSLSITSTAGEAAVLDFDVACRVKEAPGWLGSTYRILHGRPAATGGKVLIELNGMTLAIEPLTCGEVELTAAGLRIPARDDGQVLPRTVRWSYRFALGYPD